MKSCSQASCNSSTKIGNTKPKVKQASSATLLRDYGAPGFASPAQHPKGCMHLASGIWPTGVDK